MSTKATAPAQPRLQAASPGRDWPELRTEAGFRRLLFLERKRVERSSRRFVLMLAEPETGGTAEARQSFFAKLIPAIASRIRDTDVAGWYAEGRVAGVILTEIETGEADKVVPALRERFAEAFAAAGPANPARVRFHLFPDDWPETHDGRRQPLPEVPDRKEEDGESETAAWLKRTIDITGSALALTLGAPLLGAIALAVKVSSPGPVLFRQTRVGLDGKEFTFFKFRSMAAHNDASIHEEYAKNFIAGKGGAGGAGPPLYKIAADPRVTPIGRFLRRTSLDELPQLFNVLRGDMSLVGPRPPIPYEVRRYKLWHKRRFLSIRPGLTGLWQVMGRSRTTFDEMVRLDLRYSATWSVWMDLKILIRTPLAVIKGDGAC